MGMPISSVGIYMDLPFGNQRDSRETPPSNAMFDSRKFIESRVTLDRWTLRTRFLVWCLKNTSVPGVKHPPDLGDRLSWDKFGRSSLPHPGRKSFVGTFTLW